MKNENKNYAIFDEDLKKIEESVILNAMGSYQLGEVARLSGLLYDYGIDVIKELEKLHHKYNIKRDI